MRECGARGELQCLSGEPFGACAGHPCQRRLAFRERAFSKQRSREAILIRARRGPDERQVDQVALRMTAAETMGITANWPQQPNRLSVIAITKCFDRSGRCVAHFARELSVVSRTLHR